MGEKLIKRKKTRLTPASTVLLTIMFTLIAVVVIRLIYFIITGA